MNKIEEYKAEKGGLGVVDDLPRYAEGWEAITDSDKERLKWLGVFFRRQTPGRFMMRVRVPNGISNSAQLRVIAELSQECGKGFVDITTRQQIQLRWFQIDQVRQIWDRLESVGLVSLQTGMDNIRNVVGCPAAGLTANELLDASPVVKQYNDMFVGNPAYTNLPRKFNVTITGCLDHCTHDPTQDISLTPAVRFDDGEAGNGEPTIGFNVAAGGKQGSGGFRPASLLDVFVTTVNAAEVCNQITLIFRNHGSREARNKRRLAFLVRLSVRNEAEEKTVMEGANCGTGNWEMPRSWRPPPRTDAPQPLRIKKLGPKIRWARHLYNPFNSREAWF